MKYKEDVTRESSLFDIKAWYEGESNELEKWIGFGFFNHIFVSRGGNVTLYYNTEEGDRFHEVLNEKLTEDFFDKLCESFFELIEQKNNLNSEGEIFELYVRIWPALSIFDELSKYPEFGNEDMIRRLIRVRETTESFAYGLGNKINSKGPKDYIFYKGELYFMPFEDFCNEKGIEIIK